MTTAAFAYLILFIFLAALLAIAFHDDGPRYP